MRLGVFRRLRTMTRADYRLLLRAYVDLTVMAMVLRLSGYVRATRWVRPADASQPFELSTAVVARARRYAGFVRMASRYHVIGAECLLRSLVLHRWLRAEGLPSELRIGVRREGQELMGHSWVELGGHVVNDRRAAVMPFTLISTGPSSARFAEPVGADSFPSRTRS